MQVILGILLGAYLIRTVRNILYQTFLWQLKEYRIDRFAAHLRTSQGKRLLFGPVSSVKWIVLAVLILSMSMTRDTAGFVYGWHLLKFVSFFVFWIILAIEAILSVREFFVQGWKVPKWTAKAFMCAITASIVYISLLVMSSPLTLLVMVPFLDKTLAPFIALEIVFLNIPTAVYKKWIVYRARRKMNKLKNIKVVGITGSYGKTSTKEFLTMLLCQSYRVAYTPDFTNTSIGIAKHIISSLTDKYDIYVVEMGAYKSGEIREICSVVHPKIGIVTAVGVQHMELFGSKENIQRAKFELIESLPRKGLAILNGENQGSMNLAHWTEKLPVRLDCFYPSKETRDVRVGKTGIDCTFKIDENNHRVNLQLYGVQVLPNVIAAIHAAHAVGMKTTDILKALPTLRPPAQTMTVSKKTKRVTYIDDTFNANPESVSSALRYMNLYKGKRILVLSPLIELGEESENVHRELGNASSVVCDIVYLTNRNHADAFLAGASSSHKKTDIRIGVDSERDVLYLKELREPDSVVLFEGKEAGKILRLVV